MKHKVKAIHQIYYGKNIIQPGTVFEIEEDNIVVELVKLKAIYLLPLEEVKEIKSNKDKKEKEVKEIKSNKDKKEKEVNIKKEEIENIEIEEKNNEDLTNEDLI